jgi:hypothetical protein
MIIFVDGDPSSEGGTLAVHIGLKKVSAPVPASNLNSIQPNST